MHGDGTANAPINTQISSPTEEGPGSQGPGGEEGEQGPPGPAGPEKIMVVTLEDNATGNSLGWDPDWTRSLFEITAPVEVTQSTFVAATVGNPTTASNRCFLLFFTPGPAGPNAPAGGFVIDCTAVESNPPLEGATLTYIITK